MRAVAARSVRAEGSTVFGAQGARRAAIEKAAHPVRAFEGCHDDQPRAGVGILAKGFGKEGSASHRAARSGGGSGGPRTHGGGVRARFVSPRGVPRTGQGGGQASEAVSCRPCRLRAYRGMEVSRLARRFWLEWAASARMCRVLPGGESGIIALHGLVLPVLRLPMPCFLLLVILLFPRVALVLMWIFSTYLQRAFHGGLVLPAYGDTDAGLSEAGVRKAAAGRQAHVDGTDPEDRSLWQHRDELPCERVRRSGNAQFHAGAGTAGSHRGGTQLRGVRRRGVVPDSGQLRVLRSVVARGQRGDAGEMRAGRGN